MKTVIRLDSPFYMKTLKIVSYNDNVPHPYYILETVMGPKMFFAKELI
jgi:hypothetical protein